MLLLLLLLLNTMLLLLLNNTALLLLPQADVDAAIKKLQELKLELADHQKVGMRRLLGLCWVLERTRGCRKGREGREQQQQAGGMWQGAADMRERGCAGSR